MKFDRVFSIFVLLFVTLQICDSVLCPYGRGRYYEGKSIDNSSSYVQTKNCSSCVHYWCVPIREVGFLYGCPEDAFEGCWYGDDVKFIKEKGQNDMEYKTISYYYVSGCGNEADGAACLHKKQKKFDEQIADLEKKGYDFENDPPIWNAPPKPDPTNSGSTIQTGALKMIEILTIGWILSAAWF